MVDRTSGVAAYRQVADTIMAEIVAGDLEPGSALPSERELVDKFGVSRPTIRDALKFLRSRGLVYAEHGRGVFVRRTAHVTRLARNRLSREAREQNQGAFLGDAVSGDFTPSVAVRVGVEVADERIAQLLDIKVGDELVVRDRVMSANEVVVQLATSRLPRDITRGTAIEENNTGPGGTYARLEEAGYWLVTFDEVVSARMPTADEQSQLQLPDGVPVIVVTRVAYSADRAVEVNDMVLAADKYELHYRLPAD